jgi:predicted deacetylase
MTTAAATQFLPLVATPSAARDSVVVSIHDVAPNSREIAETILSQLGHNGIRVCSLLVVPDYHHRGPIAQDRQFVSWLRDLESAGHEIVIHGYFHERPRTARETLREMFITQFYTQGEGEFFDLDYDEALRRITKARDAFTEMGLKARGFIAPAWLLSRAAQQAARDAGMEYTTRLRTIVDLRTGEDFSARTLVYSVRNGWRRMASLGWNATLFQLAKNKALLRLSIHPVDYSFPAIWTQIERFINEVARVRTPTTYQDWVAEQRLRADRVNRYE